MPPKQLEFNFDTDVFIAPNCWGPQFHVMDVNHMGIGGDEDEDTFHSLAEAIQYVWKKFRKMPIVCSFDSMEPERGQASGVRYLFESYAEDMHWKANCGGKLEFGYPRVW
ncbi:MAG TPA: hypothetical protein VGP72_14635 [Planctomycetota bacterium]|jgi:hypothetical protein